ncbi:histidine N-alpha-methyltransferase [Dietzia sp. NCCP-2495]|uniref:L-histidine N(alpha)-methyltransferase n=1 Tax=Dietzia sp. NCCP-2495 TaxID=2934675 RepID=UPI0022306826|nr:L-histidine N(alpha)-methyltransferase [Dietzia sp. NCCP-2495]GLB65276.1 histidine N-alpha-methyltransferase [Dietzia sp. NCCP-2495]
MTRAREDTGADLHADDAAALEADLLAGFFDDPPTVPPRWFYDEKGSRLFDRITRLAEYYPTRAEAEILRAHAAAIVGDSTTLVELGAGTSEKTRVLLDVLAGRDGGGVTGNGVAGGGPCTYVPVDISTEMLAESSRALAHDYPGLRIEPVVGDFVALDGPLPGEPGQRLVLFLGGTIGNFTEDQRAEFFAMLRRIASPGDRIAAGFDLVKSPERLVAAYDDAEGVTAEFNLNMLDVIAATVPCSGLHRDNFRHEAVWNEQCSRIEMWLRAVRDVRIDFPSLDLARTLAAGDGIRTEIARKFRIDDLVDEVSGHGFAGPGVWTDPAGDFGMVVAVVE